MIIFTSLGGQTVFLNTIYEQQTSLLPYLNRYCKTLESRTRPFHSLSKLLRDPTAFTVIAEFKRRSPSNPLLHPHASVADVISDYEKTSASAYSILTESMYFGGIYDDLKTAASLTRRPILNKDFIIDTVQIDIAHKLGADVILLIAALGDKIDLSYLSSYAKSKGLEVLIEVHGPSCIERIKDLDYDILGVNNRDLKSLKTNVEHTGKVLRLIPEKGVPIITESGIRSTEDVKHLLDEQISGALIGTAIMNASDKAAFIHTLVEVKGNDKS